MSNAIGTVSTRATGIAQKTVLSATLWITLFASLTAIGARMEIPNTPVPYTLQTFFVLLAGAFLGPRNGALSMLLYLAAGALGAPVYAMGGFGLAHLFGPTGGYLLAFPAAALLVGMLVQNSPSLMRTVAAMAAGLFVIFAAGTAQLYAVLVHDWSAAFRAGFLILGWWDLLKLLAAAMIYREFARRWARLPRS